MTSKLRIAVGGGVLVLLAAACSSADDAVDSPATPTSVAETTIARVPESTAAATTEAATAVTDPADTLEGQSDFEVGECPIEIPAGYDVTCGTLYVPENRDAADGPEIALAVAIVHPDGAVTGPPVLYLAGGPGGSGLDDFDADPESWEYPFLEGRDLVLLDQRGTGYSQPTLDCPEITDDALPGEAERACFDRLTAEGIDIGAYTTAESAADVAALRVALGVGEWDLIGVSYGTRLALEVMRSHPAGVRSAVLDSPFPPNADTPVDEVFVFLEAFEQLLGDCEAEDYCSENYPDLAGTFLDTVAALNDEPGEITGDDLVLGVYNAFQDAGSIPLIPWVLYEVAAGNLGAFDEIAGDGGGAGRFQAAEDVSDSEGMYFSVMCHDEYAVGDFERAESAAVGIVPPELESALLQNTFEVTNTCSYWNPRDAVDDSPVVSDVPALVLVGRYDTATPPSWAALAAETLGNAFVFSFPGLGHSVLTDPCPIEIAGRFLADPLAEPDASCIDAIDWPYFE